jgi:hypothetical protein
MDIREQWERVTAELPWGVQKVLRDTLELVGEEKVHLVWGRDYSGNYPCLINSVAQMLSISKGEGGNGIPMQYFAPLVGTFDQINAQLKRDGVNTNEYVSPMAAEVLLRYFAPMKPKPIEAEVNEAMQMEAFANNISVHPDATDATRDWLNSLAVNNGIDDLTSA